MLTETERDTDHVPMVRFAEWRGEVQGRETLGPARWKVLIVFVSVVAVYLFLSTTVDMSILGMWGFCLIAIIFAFFLLGVRAKSWVSEMREDSISHLKDGPSPYEVTMYGQVEFWLDNHCYSSDVGLCVLTPSSFLFDGYQTTFSVPLCPERVIRWRSGVQILYPFTSLKVVLPKQLMKENRVIEAVDHWSHRIAGCPVLPQDDIGPPLFPSQSLQRTNFHRRVVVLATSAIDALCIALNVDLVRAFFPTDQALRKKLSEARENPLTLLDERWADAEQRNTWFKAIASDQTIPPLAGKRRVNTTSVASKTETSDE